MPSSDQLPPRTTVPASHPDLERAQRASGWLRRVLARHADWAAAQAARGYADEAGPVAQRLREALAGAADEPAFLRALRQFRNRELARLAVRDITGLATLDDTLGGLSALADAAVDAALSRAGAVLRERHGNPAASAYVLGMGKLGGGELNFSSDIDLIFGYTAPGETDGARPLSHDEFFSRLARDTARLLAVATEDGFVYRVDTLLRPFGSVGAHAASTPAMLDYYQTHGREWERYAMVKARPCAGDLAAGRAFLDALAPFVYRRYLDYNALGHLRELKGMIDRDAQAKGAANNLKLGPGGIREVEFIVQLFQLTRGGQDRRLRDARLRPMLRTLGEIGLLPAETATALDEAYVWLRRCENAVQMDEDQQTHGLPATPETQAAMAAALDLPDYDAVLAKLAPLRARVRAEFERLFAADGERPQPQPVFAAAAGHAWANSAEAEEALRERGFGDGAAAVAKAIADLGQSRLLRTLSEATQTKLRELLPLLLADACEQADPPTAAVRALEVIAAILGRGTYLTLLRESPVARRQLVRLCAASPWITALLARTPAVLDTLLDPRLAAEAPSKEALHDELRALFAKLAADDVEAQMELLRRYRQDMTLRIAAADLAGSLPLVQVSDRLTWLAEAIVAQALDCAWALAVQQFGTPQYQDGRRAGFAIIAYGKFGSIELGYGSDLDLVFIYDIDDREAMTAGGPRAIAAADFFSRLAQRIVHLLQTMTPAGRAYEVDLQLRPNGNSGLVVSSLDSFARYQRESAWTWEHQALLRARTVAGDEALRAAIETVRREVLMRARDPEKLRGEVIEMRAKMRASLEKRPPGRWDVKQGGGGLIDAEFLTQFLCLRDAHGREALVEWTDNWRQLEALAQQGRIEPARKDGLLAAERAYRGFLHRRSLQQADGLAEDAAFAPERAAVQAAWQALVLGEST